MKVTVLGAGGMLGCVLADEFSRSPTITTTATVRTEAERYAGERAMPMVRWRTFDAELDDPQSVCSQADWVVNAIGVIKPLIDESARQSVERALRVNSIFPHDLAKAAALSSTQVLQIATDCVFSGKRGAYLETDPHDPTDVYGKTKSLGEVRQSGFTNLRCSIVGPEWRTPRSLLGWLANQPPGATLRGFMNHRWNGITTLEFARVARALIESGVSVPGLQHLVPADSLTKYELLSIAAPLLGRSDIRIEPFEADEPVDRTLATVNGHANAQVWGLLGAAPPTIAEMLQSALTYGYRSPVGSPWVGLS